jgi:hypothetical protein
MWRAVISAFVLTVLTSAGVAQSVTPLQMSGCISRDANGKLLFSAERTGTIYLLHGDFNFLQQHVNTLVSVTGLFVPSGSGRNRAVLNVDSLRVISQSCTSVSPLGDRIAVEGKAGAVEKAVPTSTTASVGETTPGYQTESSMHEFTGSNAAQPAPHKPAPLAPSFPDQAGQSQTAADTNAEAASRAEMYPGTTLGVDVQTAPPSSVLAQRSQSRH